MQLRPDDLARLFGGVLDGADAAPARSQPLSGIATDSRHVVTGGAFVALRGDEMDGHGFVADAARRGAAVAVVRSGWEASDAVPPLLLRVDDTEQALREACAARLFELCCDVVGVTGSVGKTTAKEMIARALGRHVARTEGNLNTWTGVPLSVLRLDAPVSTFVAEMAMTAAGEIADICAFTHPNCGVLLNVGISHIELLGSRAAIADAKAELLEALPADGVAVCNADDDEVQRVAVRSAAPVSWFGVSERATYRVIEVVSHGLEGSEVRIATPHGEWRTRIGAPGIHLATTAAAALAVADALDVPRASVAGALAHFRGVEQRGVVRRGRGGAVVIDDSYNSAPASLAAALELLRSSGSGERVAVIGDMLELGPLSDGAHEQAGREVARAATRLIAVGTQARRLRDAAVAAGMAAERTVIASSVEDAAERALAVCMAGTTVLVKASHGLHLEQVVERLLA